MSARDQTQVQPHFMPPCPFDQQVEMLAVGALITLLLSENKCHCANTSRSITASYATNHGCGEFLVCTTTAPLLAAEPTASYSSSPSGIKVSFGGPRRSVQQSTSEPSVYVPRFYFSPPSCPPLAGGALDLVLQKLDHIVSLFRA